MPTMKTSDPTEVTLMLAVHGGGEAFGPFCAMLNLNRAEVERMLRRADVCRVNKKLDPELARIEYYEYAPEFYEGVTRREGDVPLADAQKIAKIFEDEDYPADGLREAKPDELPEQGNVRLDYCKLVIVSSVAYERPDMVDFHWVACIKHTSEEIETCEITEEVVRALLGRLAAT